MQAGEALERRLSQLGELDPADCHTLRGLPSETRALRRGDPVLRPGDRPDFVVVVLDGLLQRYDVTAAGERQVGAIFIAQDAPCLETLHLPAMDSTLAALAPSRIGLLPHRELFQAMDARPNLTALCWRETLVQAAAARMWLVRNSRLLAHAQIAHLFCELITRARAAERARGWRMDLPLSQEDLGAALGMTTVHVNRTLQLLRAGGLVEFRGGVLEVFDFPGLAEMAEFDPAYLHLRPPGRPLARSVA